MRIVYLCADRGIPIRGNKGAAVHVRALIQGFAQAGHAVTLFTVRAGAVDGSAVAAQVIEVPRPVEAAALSAEAQTRIHVEAMYAAAAEHLAAHPADLLYERQSLWSDMGARLAQATGTPLVVEVNAPLVDEAARFRALVEADQAHEIEARQLAGAHHLSVVSEEVGQYVVTRGVDPARVHVLPNAVDPQLFHPAVRRGRILEQGRPDGRIVVGFAGRARPWHDLDTLLEAFARLHAQDKRYHLLLVGEMPTDLLPRLAQLGLASAVTMTGPIPHTAMPEALAAMDVAVSPHPALEGFYFSPLKLFEYLACAVPTVTAAVGQPARLIRNGETGWLYPAGDAQALADTIASLVAQPELARRIAWQGAVETLEQHTWEGNARTVVGWVVGTATGQPAAPAAASQVVWPQVIPLPILDRKLRQRLYRATRGDLAGPLLAENRPADLPQTTWPSSDIEDIEILKYKPGRRCVLAYRLKSGATPIKVIGKIFRDERGERLRALQDYLWRSGFGPDNSDGIYVAQPLVYIPEMRMFLQEHAAGVTLDELASQGVVAAHVQRSAEALAKLHRLAPPTDESLAQYGLAEELGQLARFATDLQELRPAAAREVTGLHEALMAWAASVPETGSHVMVHRDFYYSQLLFDRSRVTLIDFDLLALGDPALDVANFTAHLHFLGLDRLGGFDMLADDAHVFHEAYARQGIYGVGFEARCAFFAAATCFRLLHVVAQRPRLAHLFDPLLAHTAGCLETA